MGQSVDVLQLTLPHGQCVPFIHLQLAQIFLISLPVPVDLVAPKLNTTFGQSAVAATLVSVPETAVDKNYLPPARKNDVRSTGQFFIMQSIAKTHAVQHASNSQLRRRVLRSDAAHQPCSTFLRQSVHGVKFYRHAQQAGLRFVRCTAECGRPRCGPFALCNWLDNRLRRCQTARPSTTAVVVMGLAESFRTRN